MASVLDRQDHPSYFQAELALSFEVLVVPGPEILAVAVLVVAVAAGTFLSVAAGQAFEGFSSSYRAVPSSAAAGPGYWDLLRPAPRSGC